MPSGQRTSTDPDLAFTSISPSSSTLASLAPVTTTSARSSPVIFTLPERAVTRITAPILSNFNRIVSHCAGANSVPRSPNSRRARITI